MYIKRNFNFNVRKRTQKCPNSTICDSNRVFVCDGFTYGQDVTLYNEKRSLSGDGLTALVTRL